MLFGFPRPSPPAATTWRTKAQPVHQTHGFPVCGALEVACDFTAVHERTTVDLTSTLSTRVLISRFCRRSRAILARASAETRPPAPNSVKQGICPILKSPTTVIQTACSTGLGWWLRVTGRRSHPRSYLTFQRRILENLRFAPRYLELPSSATTAIVLP